MEVENEKRVVESPKETVNEEEVDEMKKYVGNFSTAISFRWDPMFLKFRTWRRR